MDDFSPAAVARKVGALSKLLEARTQLPNLLTYMDGKTGAEELIAQAAERSRRCCSRWRRAPKPQERAPR